MRLTKFTTAPVLGLITLAGLIPALFLNLGLPPLGLEEPRRALVALEMVYNGDFLLPTEFGQPYFNKPPLWNWVIVTAFHLFGDYTEFAVRFFSVVSFLATGAVMYLTGRRYLEPEQAIIAALLFLVSGNLLFYFSLLGEIDLFYSFLTFTAFASLFHFYQQGSYWAAFSLFYLLNALGFLTKGMPSIAFAGISVLALLAYRRDLQRLFSVPHLVGAILFLVVAGGYFLVYAMHHPVDGYLDQIWIEASTRTLAGEDQTGRMLTHLLTFPLGTLKAILPASLLIPFLFRKHLLRRIRENPLIEFYFWIGVGNYALYWLSPGSKQRYVYMLYPLLVTLLVWFYRRASDDGRFRVHLVDGLTLLVLGLGTAAAAALPFALSPDGIPSFLPASLVGFLLATGLTVLAWKRPGLRLWTLIWLAVLLRLVMDFTVIPYKAREGDAGVMRETALEIAHRAGGESVRLYRDISFPRAIGFYLERASGQVVQRSETAEPGELFITTPDQLGSDPYQELFRFKDDEGIDYLLVRFGL